MFRQVEKYVNTNSIHGLQFDSFLWRMPVLAVFKYVSNGADMNQHSFFFVLSNFYSKSYRSCLKRTVGLQLIGEDQPIERLECHACLVKGTIK